MDADERLRRLDERPSRVARDPLEDHEFRGHLGERLVEIDEQRLARRILDVGHFLHCGQRREGFFHRRVERLTVGGSCLGGQPLGLGRRPRGIERRRSRRLVRGGQRILERLGRARHDRRVVHDRLTCHWRLRRIHGQVGHVIQARRRILDRGLVGRRTAHRAQRIERRPRERCRSRGPSPLLEARLKLLRQQEGHALGHVLRDLERVLLESPDQDAERDRDRHHATEHHADHLADAPLGPLGGPGRLGGLLRGGTRHDRTGRGPGEHGHVVGRIVPHLVRREHG